MTSGDTTQQPQSERQVAQPIGNGTATVGKADESFVRGPTSSGRGFLPEPMAAYRGYSAGVDAP
ncbi:MAG: hypothetical protein QOF87_3486 [Pseudonocardiales bacterium]|jgi:hypothetical protein|nr:hypothetical protein [Pseudonocardiales bacterium]MDT4910606.1 hypothetical protein [Pseudonocardiales bacterium]MDT4963839.1 hypothetical protein [Pseudonocardiales bacterium]